MYFDYHIIFKDGVEITALPELYENKVEIQWMMGKRKKVKD